MSGKFKIGDTVSAARKFWTEGMKNIGVIRDFSGLTGDAKVVDELGWVFHFEESDLTMIKRVDDAPRIGDRVEGRAGYRVRGILVERPKDRNGVYPFYVYEEDTGMIWGVREVRHLVRVKAGSRTVSFESCDFWHGFHS